jgi:predicted AAA+ superfamily ATPase
MEAISETAIKIRVNQDNPWWNKPSYVAPESNYPKRVYFAPFKSLALNFGVKRGTILLGPRRVGKTFMLKQLIDQASRGGIDPNDILYVSVDTPVYSGIGLEDFLYYMPKFDSSKPSVIIFDEIQYLKNWEVHLKDLIDSYPNVKFIASGSAAAALQLKSKESGAGRFTDFMLPPLTFYEFLLFSEEDEKFIRSPARSETEKHTDGSYEIVDIDGLNGRFIDYLNYGGYPEAVLNDEIRKNPERFIRNDIVDKVLLKDLPSLYGINEIQQLNRLFSFLAFNTGKEASLENITRESGLAKATIKRYIEYLESAFLIIKISMVDDNCKTMKRERNFKIYLSNPSMMAALFAPVEATEPDQIGHLAESAIFSQWQHSPTFKNLRYARWRNEGEVDIVYLQGPKFDPAWIGEIKWSDRIAKQEHKETRSMATMLRNKRGIKNGFFTSRTIEAEIVIEGRTVWIVPAAAYCYTVGRNVTSRFDFLAAQGDQSGPGVVSKQDA